MYSAHQSLELAKHACLTTHESSGLSKDLRMIQYEEMPIDFAACFVQIWMAAGANSAQLPPSLPIPVCSAVLNGLSFAMSTKYDPKMVTALQIRREEAPAAIVQRFPRGN
jgi:hypothetical protein